MLFVLGVFVGFIGGAIIAAMIGNGEDDCPRVVMQYNCREWTGKECDHSEVALRRAQLQMAEGREMAETPEGRRKLGIPNVIKKNVKKEQQK